jgi:hypothetical protein
VQGVFYGPGKIAARRTGPSPRRRPRGSQAIPEEVNGPLSVEAAANARRGSGRGTSGESPTRSCDGAKQQERSRATKKGLSMSPE